MSIHPRCIKFYMFEFHKEPVFCLRNKKGVAALLKPTVLLQQKKGGKTALRAPMFNCAVK